MACWQCRQALAQAGGDIHGKSLPYIPGGDEAAGCPHARVGGPVQVVEYLPADVPEHQQVEHASGGVANEVQIVDSLRDDLQTWAGRVCLYIWA